MKNSNLLDYFDNFVFMDFDSLQFWLYVLIGVIYLIARARSKAKQARNEAPERGGRNFAPTQPPPTFERASTQQRPSSQPKVPTFEELLREITEARSQPKQPEYVDYDDFIEEEAKDLEDVNVDYRKSDQGYQLYEEAKRQAFNRPSLEETAKLEDTKVSYSKFKEFETQAKRNLLDDYTKDLRDPEGFKKALVMSEILNRRHF